MLELSNQVSLYAKLSYTILSQPFLILPGFLSLSVFPSSSPIEEENVLLRCVVDHMLYSSLKWYRVLNVSNPDKLPSAVPCASISLAPLTRPNATIATLEGTNFTLDLSLPRASWQDQGLYACRVENADSSERTCLLHNLHLKRKLSIGIGRSLKTIF